MNPTSGKLPFVSVFRDVCIFHNRLISCVVRHKKQSHRPVQVLSLVTQLMIAAAFVSVVMASVDGSAVPIVPLTILAMRPVQMLFVGLEHV